MADAYVALPLPSFAKPVRLLIVSAPQEPEISASLLAGAKAMAARAGAEVEVLEVPGALELPPALALAERLAEFDGYAALGLIMGSGPVQMQMAAEVGRALMALNLGGACIGQAVLLASDRAEALGWADPAGQDKGGGAVAAALHLIAISRKWAGQTKGIGFRA
jgi:6,7-dimethyl-8-ribityllumazine synthase